MSDPRAWLAEVQERASKATEGPWAAWLDQDGQPHMNHMLMVGNAGAVIPDGETWIEGVDVNPVAHTYTPEDREFIAHARTDNPAMAAALTAVLDLHPRKERLLCGAMSEVPHRHGDEQEPYPIRPVVCTLEQGHDGDHQDAICCWNFQRFTEAACYKSEKWADRSTCVRCGQEWPCADVRTITEHLNGEDE